MDILFVVDISLEISVIVNITILVVFRWFTLRK